MVKCACGKIFKAAKTSLVTRNTKSCGCGFFRNDPINTHPAYEVWKGMKARCYNQNKQYYELYGGRGIKVCSQWINDSKAFLKWADENGYKKGLFIDRKDPNGHYSPENCRFVNSDVSAQNTRLISKRNSSGFRGVTLHKRKNGSTGWRSRITIQGKVKSLGVYDDKEAAARAYDNFIDQHKTEHPKNFI